MGQFADYQWSIGLFSLDLYRQFDGKSPTKTSTKMSFNVAKPYITQEIKALVCKGTKYEYSSVKNQLSLELNTELLEIW